MSAPATAKHTFVFTFKSMTDEKEPYNVFYQPADNEGDDSFERFRSHAIMLLEQSIGCSQDRHLIQLYEPMVICDDVQKVNIAHIALYEKVCKVVYKALSLSNVFPSAVEKLVCLYNNL